MPRDLRTGIWLSGREEVVGESHAKKRKFPARTALRPYSFGHACCLLPCAHIPMNDETENFTVVMNSCCWCSPSLQVNRMDVDCNLKNEQFVTLKNEMAAQYADLYFGWCTHPRGPLRDVLAIPPPPRRSNLVCLHVVLIDTQFHPCPCEQSALQL